MEKKRINIKHPVPDYLRGKYQLIATVTFTAFFSLVFMLISIPFSHNAWFALGTSRAFGFTAAFYFISLLVIIVSKRLMYMTRSHRMSYISYILWDLAEVFVICALYALFTLKADEVGIINIGGDGFMDIFLAAFVYAFSSLIIPYIISGMFFAIIDKNNTIRLMNTSEVVSDEPVGPRDPQQVALYDNSGVLKLSVSLSHLFYIESDDNYIIVWYMDSKDELRKYMIRSRLKTVEESFKGSSLVRCHRKYIVNMAKVQSLRKEKDGYELDLEEKSIPPIPITKTYSENVLSRFKSRQ